MGEKFNSTDWNYIHSERAREESLTLRRREDELRREHEENLMKSFKTQLEEEYSIVTYRDKFDYPVYDDYSNLYPQRRHFMEKPRKEEPVSNSEQILRKALIDAKATIQKQNKVLQQLLTAPTMRGYVISVLNTKVLISIPGSGLVEVAYPEVSVHGKSLSASIKNGIMVRMQMDPVPAIIDILPVEDNITGDLVTVTKEGKDNECEVEWQGTTRIIRFGDIKMPEIGDRILVDADCHVALRNQGPDESKFSFQGVTGITWDQIGGLQNAKDALQEAIELPFQHPELYKRYNKKPVKGVLLYGPPGCGKTLLAKAAATSLSSLHERAQANTGFIYVKGPELLNKFVGNTEAQVRSLFAQARNHFKKHGYPAIIFIDEADALLSSRGSRESMGIESTVVPQFLAEMDGLDESGAMVLLATNRPDSLDSAVTRDGRIDRKVQVTRPTQDEAVNIFKIYLKDKPLFELSVDEMAVLAAESLYAKEFNLHKKDFTLGNLVNGAMIAGMVDKASTIALRREIVKQGEEGICKEDVLAAAISIFEQNRHLNHEEEFREFMLNNNIKSQSATI